MSDIAWTIRGGDVYCPFCGDSSIAVDFTFEDHFWFCDRCRRQWKWDHNGVDWVWPDDVPKPTPGCPWCGTQNIRGGLVFDQFGTWYCQREMCGKSWVGAFTVARFTKDGPLCMSRWTIRIPARDVPFRRTLDNPTTYPHQETS
jgi:transposase-like protein